MELKNPRFSIGYLLAALVALFVIQLVLAVPHAETLADSDFKALVKKGPTGDRYLMTRAELLDRLDVLLGGRVAEELVFGDVSTGAQDDLQRATDMARHMVARYGMSEALGLATFDAPRQALFLNVPGRRAAAHMKSPIPGARGP